MSDGSDAFTPDGPGVGGSETAGVGIDKKLRSAAVWFLGFFGVAFLSVMPATIAFRFFGEMLNPPFDGDDELLVLDLYNQSLKSFHFL